MNKTDKVSAPVELYCHENLSLFFISNLIFHSSFSSLFPFIDRLKFLKGIHNVVFIFFTQPLTHCLTKVGIYIHYILKEKRVDRIKVITFDYDLKHDIVLSCVLNVISCYF